MRRGSVDERGPERAEAAFMTERGAASAAIHARARGTNVVAMAGRHAQAGDIEEETSYCLARGGRERRGLRGGKPRGKFFSECRHASVPSLSHSQLPSSNSQLPEVVGSW